MLVNFLILVAVLMVYSVIIILLYKNFETLKRALFRAMSPKGSRDRSDCCD